MANLKFQADIHSDSNVYVSKSVMLHQEQLIVSRTGDRIKDMGQSIDFLRLSVI